MNRKVLLALLAVAVLAGVAIWWARRGNESGDDSQKPAAADRAKQPNLGVGQRENRRGDVDMAMPVMIDDDPKGVLVLEGQVIDKEDHGIGGVTVVLSSNP